MFPTDGLPMLNESQKQTLQLAFRFSNAYRSFRRQQAPAKYPTPVGTPYEAWMLTNYVLQLYYGGTEGGYFQHLFDALEVDDALSFMKDVTDVNLCLTDSSA